MIPLTSDHVPRVLIVDDEPNNRRLLEVMLAPEGLDVRSAASGREALALVAQQAPDLILLDVMMAGMDGYAVAAAIKGAPATKTIPIIMVSVRDDREARMRGLHAGAEDFLSKPVDRAELCVRVRNLLRLKAYSDYHDNYGQMLETEVGSRTADLVASEARYRRIVETTGEGIWEIDEQANTTFLNTRMAEMLGYAPHELVGRSPVELLHEEGVRQFAVIIAQLRRSERAPQVEVRFKRRDQTTLWTLLETCPILDPSGKVTGFLAMAMDISERKRGERALVERLHVEALGATIAAALTSSETLPAILQRCTDAIVADLDAASALIWTWRADTKQLELQARTGLVEPPGAFELGEVARERRPFISSDLQTGARFLDREWALREGLAAFAGYPVLVDGELLGVLAISARTPLTEVARKGLASAVDTIAIGIRGKLAEQANKLLEEQLRQSQKMEAVGRLAGGIAHDFNNLLSVVLSYADFAIEDLRASDPVLADIEEIRRAGLRAADLTKQLLTFSRQQVIAPQALDLNVVLTSMDNMLRRILGEDVTLTTLPGSSLGAVRADPGSIEQVIMNLVINARDAMPKGGEITMKTANIELDEQFASTHLGVASGPHVMISVMDTGTGIDSVTMARIFEPFFTTKAIGKGTGLGLSTVFGIAQQSGGTVWVYSELGVGTTFKFYLPRVEAIAEARAPRETAVGRGSETILLVEDEDQVRAVARGILRRSGYTVLEASNGGEALLLCERQPAAIDLLVSDIVMPGMSGPELAARLAVTHPAMRTLLMSGHTDDATLRHGLADPQVAYLQKPLTLETLARKVRDVLDR